MAKVTLTVAGYAYELACRDGEEAHFTRLAEILDEKAVQATRAVGGLTEMRMLLYAGLLLADENNGLRTGSAPPLPDVSREPPESDRLSDPLLARAVAALASRIEALATGLEAEAPTA